MGNLKCKECDNKDLFFRVIQGDEYCDGERNWVEDRWGEPAHIDDTIYCAKCVAIVEGR